MTGIYLKMAVNPERDDCMLGNAHHDRQMSDMSETDHHHITDPNQDNDVWSHLAIKVKQESNCHYTPAYNTKTEEAVHTDSIHSTWAHPASPESTHATWTQAGSPETEESDQFKAPSLTHNMISDPDGNDDQHYVKGEEERDGNTDRNYTMSVDADIMSLDAGVDVKNELCEKDTSTEHYTNNTQLVLNIQTTNHIMSGDDIASKDNKQKYAANQPIKCMQCSKTFGRNSNLTRHIRNVHQKATQQYCSECNKHFSSSSTLKVHILRAHKPRTCSMCQENFSCSQALRQHIHDAHATADDLLIKCSLCKKDFSTSSNLNKHVYNVHNHDKQIREIKCFKCNQKFTTSSELRWHTHQAHREVSKYDAHQLEFSNSGSLNRHICDQLAITTERKYDNTLNALGTNVLVSVIPSISQIVRKNYSCCVCCERFEFSKSLKSHMKVHVLDEEFSCFMCRAVVYQLTDLITHITKQHGPDQPSVDCKVSTVESTTSDSVQEENTSPDKIVHICTTCGQICTYLLVLKRHQAKTHNVKKKTCPVCFKAVFQLASHMLSHTGEKPYKCDKCEYSSAQRGSLNLHMLRHSEQKNHQCQQCGKLFYTAHILNKHTRTHSGQEQYKVHRCTVCDKRFYYSNLLLRHMSIHTGEKPWACDVCGQTFTFRTGLNAHMKSHSDSRPHLCIVCGFRFKRPGDLQRHTRSHTGEKPYKCKVCGKGYMQSDGRKKHMRSHTGEKPYMCWKCGVQFAHANRLKLHKCGKIRVRRTVQPGASVKDDKSYKCDVCGESIIGLDQLTKHMKFHNTDRPFECEKCRKRFGNKNTLTIHMRTHTGEKPYTCSECNQCFSQPGNLERHVIRKHTNQTYKPGSVGKK